MSSPTISPDTRSAISSLVSGSGHTLYGSPDGVTIDQSGQVHHLASLSARQAKDLGLLTSGTFGPPSSGLSKHVVPPPSLENKSPAPASLALRVCKACDVGKSMADFRPHNRNGHRWTCRRCENQWIRTTKPWSSESKKAYQRKVRQVRRGFCLVNDARSRAKVKKLPCTLDWRDVQAQIEAGFCEVSGLPFDMTTPKAWNAPSLDRIDPKQGYTIENTRVVLYAVNAMANDWGLDQALEIARAIMKHRSL